MSGLFGGGGAEKASQAAQDAAREARAAYDQAAERGIAFSKEQYEKGRQDLGDYYNKGQGYLDPYLGAGKSALADYLASMGMGPEGSQQGILDRFRNMPGYQFGLDAGRQAIDRSAAAAGMQKSGALLKALTQYGQDYADQQFGKYQDRLAGLAGLGQETAGMASGNAMQTGGNLANLGANLASSVAGMYGGMGQNAANAALAAGQARASGYINQQNSQNNLFGQIAQGAGYLMGGPVGSSIGKYLFGG